MKKFGVSAALMGIVLAAPSGAGAAYPVYQNANNQIVANGQVIYYPNQATTQAVPNQNQVIMVNPNVAANPTRITGTLPKVGSNVTAAGRQYYQPADYDRLADSGLYIGFSAAYMANIDGSMRADYIGEKKSYTAPGAFANSDYQVDTVIPLQVSVGATINNDFRVDFSYTRYSGFSYPNQVLTAADDSNVGNTPASVEGGAITANTTMLNIYYNLDSYTGYIAGGSLRPYIGAGVGISLNTIADYVVYDDTYYKYIDDLSTTTGKPGLLTGISDIYGYHNGGTNEQLAFMVEGGITTDLGGGIRMDFFARYANLGRVKTSGSIVVSQIEWLSTGTGLNDGTGEAPADYDSVFHYTNWYESGRLSMIDVGARLRLQF